MATKKTPAPRRAGTANENASEFARLALELAVLSPERFRAVLEDMRREDLERSRYTNK